MRKMRRVDKESRDHGRYRKIMDTVLVGWLSLVDADGYPRAIPVNFALYDEKIYFHGARTGEKFDLLEAGPKATFAAAIEHAVLPSYWSDPEDGCGTTQLYESALAYGRGAIVKETKEKAAALEALMRKYQPEGRYRSFAGNEEHYAEALRRTALFRIEVQRWSLKLNLGRQLSEDERSSLISHLEERNDPGDAATIAAIKSAGPETFQQSDA